MYVKHLIHFLASEIVCKYYFSLISLFLFTIFSFSASQRKELHKTNYGLGWNLFLFSILCPAPERRQGISNVGLQSLCPYWCWCFLVGERLGRLHKLYDTYLSNTVMLLFTNLWWLIHCFLDKAKLLNSSSKVHYNLALWIKISSSFPDPAYTLSLSSQPHIDYFYFQTFGCVDPFAWNASLFFKWQIHM